MREFQAEVVDIRDEGVTEGRRRWQLLLTHSQFDGVEGVLVAVSPSGTRLEVPVLGVVVEDADVWHVVEKPLAAGTPVTGRVFGVGDEAVERAGSSLLHSKSSLGASGVGCGEWQGMGL